MQHSRMGAGTIEPAAEGKEGAYPEGGGQLAEQQSGPTAPEPKGAKDGQDEQPEGLADGHLTKSASRRPRWTDGDARRSRVHGTWRGHGEAIDGWDGTVPAPPGT